MALKAVRTTSTAAGTPAAQQTAPQTQQTQQPTGQPPLANQQAYSAPVEPAYTQPQDQDVPPQGQQFVPPMQYAQPQGQQYAQPQGQQYAQPQGQQYAQPQGQQYAQPQGQQYAQPQGQQYSPQVQQQYVPPASNNISAAELTSINGGILEGLDEYGSGGNFVSVDGSDFLYKASNETSPYIDVVVSYGKLFYQWVDETDPNAKKYYNSDTKLDSNYKLKFEIRWFEDRDNEPVEFTHTLSTTSAIGFMQYLKNLGARGFGVGSVVTRLTISRQVSKDKQNRYSRVEMEAFDLAAYQQDQLVPLGVKTPEAKAFQ